MSEEYDYVCNGNSCCLVPKYKMPPKTTKECVNNKICFNEISIELNEDFCEECKRLPIDEKRINLISDGTCSVCDKEGKTIKRESCDHTICVNCFRKIYFGKSFSKPVFPYLTENISDENDKLVLKYKEELKYWEKFQILHLKNHSECHLKV